jgi:hypothetical protein
MLFGKLDKSLRQVAHSVFKCSVLPQPSCETCDAAIQAYSEFIGSIARFATVRGRVQIKNSRGNATSNTYRQFSVREYLPLTIISGEKTFSPSSPKAVSPFSFS